MVAGIKFLGVHVAARLGFFSVFKSFIVDSEDSDSLLETGLAFFAGSYLVGQCTGKLRKGEYILDISLDVYNIVSPLVIATNSGSSTAYSLCVRCMVSSCTSYAPAVFHQ